MDSNQTPVRKEPVCEVTGNRLDANKRVVLKDVRGDNHYFENWRAVIIWAQTQVYKADKLAQKVDE